MNFQSTLSKADISSAELDVFQRRLDQLNLEPDDKETRIFPQASTCTWCGKSLFFDNHCKTREEAAHCSNYRERRG